MFIRQPLFNPDASESSSRPLSPQKLKRLIDTAQSAAEKPVRSVMDKPVTPSSGNKHDYFSLAKYTWPNPNTADGLPYEHRDGIVNPEVETYDAPNWHRATGRIIDCTKAAILGGRDDLAKAAADQVHAWFLDPATRMTPHLRHAQFVPGTNDGRPYGIIDWSGSFPNLLETWLPFAPEVFTAQQHDDFAQWCGAFLDWLLDDPFACQAGEYANNHAVYYDTLIAYLCIALGRNDRARQILQRVPTKRITTQIEPDGRMPHELRRTKSLSYTVMNLNGFIRLATLAEHVDVDLWSWQSKDGRSLRGALMFLYEYLCGTEPWPYEQIEPPPYGRTLHLIQTAQRVYGEAFQVDRMMHRTNPDPRSMAAC